MGSGTSTAKDSAAHANHTGETYQLDCYHYFLLLAVNVSVSLKEGDMIPQVVFKIRVRDNSLKIENPFVWKVCFSNIRCSIFLF